MFILFVAFSYNVLSLQRENDKERKKERIESEQDKKERKREYQCARDDLERWWGRLVVASIV